MNEYTDEHARAGITAPLPAIETWPNQYPDYEIAVEIPEYNAICPKTGLPDFGHLTIRYVPDRLCLELKSLKLYIVAYRNLGIFYENAVNRILEDCVAACRPKTMTRHRHVLVARRDLVGRSRRASPRAYGLRPADEAPRSSASFEAPRRSGPARRSAIGCPATSTTE